MFAVVSFCCILAIRIAHSQSQADIEYGIGFVGPGQFKVYMQPSDQSKVLAIVHSFEITFAGNTKPESQIPYCIEVVYNDIYGFPILAYSPDSLWVNISLDCRIKKNPPSGWINISEDSPDAKLWGSYWTPGFQLYFIDKKSATFYDTSDGKLLNIQQLMPQFDTSSYCMLVEKIQGSWMKVTVESPETPIDMKQKDIQRELGVHYFQAQAWIRFLNNTGRPRVFAPSAD